MNYSNYVDRGIIKWAPFKSLDAFFSTLKNQSFDFILSAEDKVLFDNLLEKYSDEVYDEKVYEHKLKSLILCIDVKSFYASAECVFRGLDVYTTKLAVVGDINNKGSIIMANSHALKQQYKVSNVMRYFELDKILKANKDKDTIIADTHMQRFVDKSIEFTSQIANIISFEDIYHYSIDELFLDYYSYRSIYGDNYNQFASALKEFLFIKTGLPIVIGMHNTMVGAKYCLDIFAKKSPNSIAFMNSDLYSKFLKITDFTNVWGIGHKISLRLGRLGCKQVQDVVDIDPSLLSDEFGVIGVELQQNLMLNDCSHWNINKFKQNIENIGNIKLRKSGKVNLHQSMIKTLKPPFKSVGHGQTLFRDYADKELETIIFDMCLHNVKEMLKKGVKAKVVRLTLRFSKEEADYSSGFNVQGTLDNWTNDMDVIFGKIMELHRKKYWRGTKVRLVSISFSNLIWDNEKSSKKAKILSIMNDFDTNSKPKVFFATQLKKESNFIKRYSKIGGHKK